LLKKADAITIELIRFPFSLDNLSSENIPSTLKDYYITFLGFSSSEFNVFLFVDNPFKDFFPNRK